MFAFYLPSEIIRMKMLYQKPSKHDLGFLKILFTPAAEDSFLRHNRYFLGGRKESLLNSALRSGHLLVTCSIVFNPKTSSQFATFSRRMAIGWRAFAVAIPSFYNNATSTDAIQSSLGFCLEVVEFKVAYSRERETAFSSRFIFSWTYAESGRL